MLPSALLLALTGTLLIFNAEPGINWGIWATLVAVGMLGAQWMERGRVGRVTAALAALGCAFAWGAAVTGSEPVLVLNVLAGFTAFSLAVLSMPDERGVDVTLPRMILGPMEAPVRCVAEAGRRVQGAAVHAGREESLPVLRGVAFAVPVVGVFGLALSGADPVFAAWRESAVAMVADFPMGELVFGSVLFLGSLGAFGISARGGRPAPRGLSAVPRLQVQLGATERLIVFGAIAALFACFLVLQLTYLFGNAPAVPESGVTFAEYARRGFFELTFVAVACGVLLATLRGKDGDPGDARVIQVLELAIVGEVLLLLMSAFRKMLLYEAAYGYTVSRVWVQALMIVIALSLAALALELRGPFDVHRLARRTAAVGAAMLLTFTYWNHEGWITTRNLERFESTGRYDVSYVTYQLSANAVPAALEAARVIGGVRGICMDRLIRERWAARPSHRDSWFETNLAASRAHAALGAAPWHGVPPGAWERSTLMKCAGGGRS